MRSSCGSQTRGAWTRPHTNIRVNVSGARGVASSERSALRTVALLLHVGRCVFAGEKLLDVSTGRRPSAVCRRPRLGLQAIGVEDGPVAVADLGLHPHRCLRQDIPQAMNQTSPAQRGREDLLDRNDQTLGSVGDAQQRVGQAPVFEVG
jgi:hypothetical protein